MTGRGDAGRRRTMSGRGRRNDAVRTRVRGDDVHRRRKHGKENRGAVVIARGTVSACADSDAAGVNAVRSYGHASRNVRPVRVIGAAGEHENGRGGKKPELHGNLLGVFMQMRFGRYMTTHRRIHRRRPSRVWRKRAAFGRRRRAEVLVLPI